MNLAWESARQILAKMNGQSGYSQGYDWIAAHGMSAMHPRRLATRTSVVPLAHRKLPRSMLERLIAKNQRSYL